MLTAKELKGWRDGLLSKMAPATINRLCRCMCAALELAAQHDKRIQNREAWEIGLAGLPDAQQSRNVVSRTKRSTNLSPPPTCWIISWGC